MQKAREFIFHTMPNLILVIGLVLLIQFDLSPLAFALLAISKWQLLLGGPRAWIRNFRDNGCDLVVALSAVSAMVLFNDDLVLQSVVAISYGGWLFFLEPLKSKPGIALQAGICQASGLTMLFLLGRSIPELLVIGGSWIVALVAAEHFLSPYEDVSSSIITLGWGLLVAEFSWLMWRWLIVYSLFNGRVLLPQAPLVITIVGYVLGGMYLDHRNRKLKKRRLLEYVLISFGLLLVIIFGTKWDTRL